MSLRRIVVAPDPAAPRDDVFQALLAVCDAADADITTLFVEDDNLLRLAALPGSVEIRTVPAPSSRRLDPDALRAQYDQRAGEIRARSEHAALALRLHTRFAVVRGDVPTELARAGAGADVLVIGRAQRSAGVRTWLGVAPERLLALLHPSPPPPALLFVHEPWRSGRCVTVLDSGDPAGARARTLAAAVARREQLPLEVLEVLDERGTSGPESLRRMCIRRAPRVLVMPLALAGDGGLDAAAMVRDLPTSLLLVP